MANYFEMDRDALAAEKAKLEEEYKKFQALNLKLNMARGKPGPHQMDLAMGPLQMTDYTTDAGTDARNYGDLEGLHEARELFADVMGVKPEEVFVGGNSACRSCTTSSPWGTASVSPSLPARGRRWRNGSSSARCPAMTVILRSRKSSALR